MILDDFLGDTCCNIFVANWSCEDIWRGNNGLKIPYLDLYNKNITVQYLDELFIYLARYRDVIVLRKEPDMQFQNYLKSLNVSIPIILFPKKDDVNKSITELIIEDQDLLKKLKDYVSNNISNNIETNLIPYGITVYEERLSEIINVKLHSRSEITSKLNCKTTLRELAYIQGITFPHSDICNGVDELEEKSKNFLKNFGPLVIKELYGSAGSGLRVVKEEKQLVELCNILRRIEQRDGTIIIEEWCDATVSYNHQYIINKMKIVPCSYSRQIFFENDGKIKGSYFESGNSELREKHHASSAPILERIKDSGYLGIVGLDSVVGDEKTFYPVVDVNCRINLSTIFQNIILSYFPVKHACFIAYEAVLTKYVSFDTLHKLVEEKKYRPEKKEGIVILNYSSLNENLLSGRSRYGKIFFALFSENLEKIKELYMFLKTNMNLLEN